MPGELQLMRPGRQVGGYLVCHRGKKKANKESWWWNEDVQECRQRKREHRVGSLRS